MGENFTYCPICQLPLNAISISPDLHVSVCMARCDENEKEECSKGVHCLSTDVFHYRDFSHKLLAAYRSSADFVPPEIEIKPSPKKRRPPLKVAKRSSPRKSKTPVKSCKNKINITIDSESDSEVLIEPKRPRRILKFNEKSPSKTTSQSSCIKTKTSVTSDGLTKAAKECDNIEKSISSDKDKMSVSLNSKHKLTSVNVELNAGDELRFTESRCYSSLSSMSVATTRTSSSAESDVDSETSNTSGKVPVTDTLPVTKKILLKQPVLTFENVKVNDILQPQLKDRKNNIFDETNSNQEIDEAETETNVSLSNTDFDDIIPGSLLDKELLKTVEMKLDSPAMTIHTFSEYNGTGTPGSSVTEDDTVGDRESIESTGIDAPSSPEVIIPSKTRKMTAFLTSSSDSDLPLASLVHKKSAFNKSAVKGKVKAGKILRISNKTPVYVNGSLKSPFDKNENNVNSSKDSDSGKSTASKDTSFVPTERNSESSSQNTDSAFSAESTDRLTASLVSSTYSSSEDYTNESRSSDPSYSEESDMNINTKLNKSQKTPNYNRKKQTKQQPLIGKRTTTKHAVKTLSSPSDSGSSEISTKEKLVFGTKKISPKSKTIMKPSFLLSAFHSREATDVDDKSAWQSMLSKMRNDCFPSDLKIDSEDSLTVASSCSSSDTSHTSSMLPLRQCPFYKKIPDTPFAVDAFQYWNIPGVKAYFLSHFHSDHYIGLKKNFAHTIYCSQITANLVRMKLRVDEKWLRVMELNKPQIISGVEVTALDANHCPGSFMFLFCLSNGRSHLHVGDFRASKTVTSYSCLQTVSISKLFLDTTYCSPQYCFPTQEEVIEKMVDIVRGHVKSHPRTLVVCGSYTIGKEKMFLGIAEALDWRVWARPEKQRVFTCLNDPRINSRLVKDCQSANVHVLPMASVQLMPLQQHLQSCMGAFTHVVGVKPTGWELNTRSNDFKVTSRNNITIYGVPYSEHSSFSELRDFVRFLQPHEVVPTVNVGSAASRGKMSKHFAEWLRPQTERQTKVSQYFMKSQ